MDVNLKDKSIEIISIPDSLQSTGHLEVLNKPRFKGEFRSLGNQLDTHEHHMLNLMSRYGKITTPPLNSRTLELYHNARFEPKDTPLSEMKFSPSPWKQHTEEIVNDSKHVDHNSKILHHFDMKDFNARDISIAMKKNLITIYATHDWRYDAKSNLQVDRDHCYELVLPDDSPPKDVSALLTSDGYLLLGLIFE